MHLLSSMWHQRTLRTASSALPLSPGQGAVIFHGRLLPGIIHGVGYLRIHWSSLCCTQGHTFDTSHSWVKGFPGGWEVKASASNAGDPGSIPGLGRSLEKGKATHSSILAWRIPWTEEPGKLQSTGLQRVRHDWATSLHFIPGSLEKQESSRKTFISALLTMPKPLTVWITTNCGKFWKIWAYQTTWPASWETCIQVRKQQLELDMEQLNWNNRLVHRVAKSWTRLSELNWTDVKECSRIVCVCVCACVCICVCMRAYL